MKKLSHFLIKNFDLKPQEINKFLLLFMHSFFLGLAGAFYFTPANSEFIKYYGSEQLPWAYLGSGLAGYGFTTLYSFFQKRINSKKLFFGAIILMTVLTLLSRFLVGAVDAQYLSAFVFIWAWPFLSIIGIECGGLSLQFLNLIQVKRLFALFSIGGVLSAVFGYLTIPLLNKVISHSYDLLYISVLGFMIGLGFLAVLYNKYYNEKPKNQEEVIDNGLEDNSKKEKPKTFWQLMKVDYFKYIFICTIFSMAIIYITDFSFLSTVKIHISPENISQFLALVYGGLKVGELIISFFSSRLLSKYGVKLGLTILPAFSLFIVLLAAITGISNGVESLLFLILITINKSQERILRRGLDDPAFNILYQPLPDSEKFSVQTKVGIISQVSIFVAGLFILGVNYLITTTGEYKFMYFMFFFLPVLVAWFWSARKLYFSYKGNIRQILSDISKGKSKESKFQYGIEMLKKGLRKATKSQEFVVTVLSETSPRELEAYAATLLESDNQVIIKSVLKNIDPTWRKRVKSTVDKILTTSSNNETRLYAERASNYLDYSELMMIDESQFKQLVYSDYVCDQMKAIQYMFCDSDYLKEEFLLLLIQSRHRNVVLSAINLASKLSTPKVVETLIYLLQNKEYYSSAGSVLLDMGDKVLPELNKYFDNCLQSDILVRIIELYGKFGSLLARGYLVKNINYPNRDVQINVINALYFCKYQATDEKEIEIIKHKISEIVDNILWIMATTEDIEEQNTLKLTQALDLEKQKNLELLFRLFSCLYEPRIITLIEKNIIGKNTVFALEIIDNYFTQDIKQLVVPLFDDMSNVQKIKKLSNYFPQEKLSFNDRLKEIIKRDHTKLDTWTVSKAVEQIGKLHKTKTTNTRSAVMDYHDLNLWVKGNIDDLLSKIRKSEMPDEIFVCLYHFDEQVYSAAAKIIFDENPIKCADYLTNMSSKKQQLYTDLNNNSPLLVDKVKQIKKIPMYYSVPENLLIKLAKNLRVRDIKKDEYLDLSTQKADEIIIVQKGMLSSGAEKNPTYFGKNEFVIQGLNIDHSISKLLAKKDTTVLMIKRADYFNILIQETDILKYLLESLES